MKGNARILTMMLALLLLASSAQAGIKPISASPGNDVEPGRSSVPTVRMITREEQRELVNAWPQTGSLTPASPQNDGNAPSTGTACPPGGGNTGADNPPSTGTACPSGSDCTAEDCADESDCPTAGCPAATCGTGANCPPSPGANPDPDGGDSGTDGHYTPGSLTSQEQSLANSVNQERVARGLSPLAVDAELSAIARAKSIDMVENSYFAHESPTYGSAADMLDDAGYGYRGVGENIAHAGSVERAHDLLMASPGHRANILGSQWTKLGIGIVSDRNGYPMITELFVR